MNLFRNLLFWLLLALVGALLAQVLLQDPGYVLVRYRGTDYSTTLAAALSYGLDRFTTVGLGYTYVDVRGSTPLSIDVVDPASTFSLGLVRAIPDRYRLAATVYYNAVVPETILQAFVGAIVTRSLEIGLFVDYNFRLASFTDIDYTLRWICDCIDIAVRYRQVRREISIEFGLVGFTQRGAPFVPRSLPPPPLTLPPP